MIIELAAVTLTAGGHDGPDDGMCLMEAVALFAGEPWSAAPACVSPVLTAFGISLNDRLPDDRRQLLRPLIPQLIGTRGDGLDGQRGYLALDWLIRTYTPAWLDLAGLTAEATTLRDLRRIVDLAAARSVGPVVRAAQARSAAARAAARAAAWDAAWDAAGAAAWAAAGAAARAAARAAAWDAAWDAAGAAAWAAAGAAAWDAAWDAAGDAARAAAGAAAWDAAWDAAGDAARAAAWAAARAAARDAAGDAARAAARAAARDAARDAARAAARDALKPTVDQLQTSAIALFAGMIRPEATS